MKLFPYLKLAMFLLVFSGTVAFYVWYDKRSVIDSVLFVALTITTIGYENDEPSVASRLFTTFLMVFGILFIFTYIKDVLHAVARTIKNSIIPTLNLEHYVGAMLVVSLSLLVLTVFVGVMFVCYNEQLGFVTGLYFIVYTVTTVGYGDVPIKTLSTKIFLVFYVLMVPIIVAFTFDAIISLPARIARKRQIEDILLDRIALPTIMVDFDAQQEKLQASQRLKKRYSWRRGLPASFNSALLGRDNSASSTSKNNSRNSIQTDVKHGTIAVAGDHCETKTADFPLTLRVYTPPPLQPTGATVPGTQQRRNTDGQHSPLHRSKPSPSPLQIADSDLSASLLSIDQHGAGESKDQNQNQDQNQEKAIVCLSGIGYSGAVADVLATGRDKSHTQPVSHTATRTLSPIPPQPPLEALAQTPAQVQAQAPAQEPAKQTPAIESAYAPVETPAPEHDGPAEALDSSTSTLLDLAEDIAQDTGLEEGLFRDLHAGGQLDTALLFGIGDAKEVTKYEFVLSILVYMDKVKYDRDIYPWAKKFDRIDEHHTGKVSKQALAALFRGVVDDGAICEQV